MQPPGHHGDGKLLGIQAARGIAALLVVAYHAERALSLPQYVGRMPLDGITGFGHAGVDFFFVLSGFIILTVHGVDLGQPGRFRRYAARRVCRIYPPYWIVTALVLMLTFAGTAGTACRAGSILARPCCWFRMAIRPSWASAGRLSSRSSSTCCSGWPS